MCASIVVHYDEQASRTESPAAAGAVAAEHTLGRDVCHGGHQRQALGRGAVGRHAGGGRAVVKHIVAAAAAANAESLKCGG